jgi:hypothetical protein
MINVSQLLVTLPLSLILLCPIVSHAGTTITVSGVEYNLETITSTGTGTWVAEVVAASLPAHIVSLLAALIQLLWASVPPVRIAAE